jgi:hypothetical protein
MKVEFIKEETLDGTLRYYTEVNGRYVDGSIEFEEAKGKIKFDRIVKNGSSFPIKTVIESVKDK